MPSEVHTRGLLPVSTLSTPEQSKLMKNENAPLTHPNPAPNRHTKTLPNKAGRRLEPGSYPHQTEASALWLPASADWGSGDGGGGRTRKPGSEEAKDC